MPRANASRACCQVALGALAVDRVGHLADARLGVQNAGEGLLVEGGGRREEVFEYHVTMVAQPELHDKDLVLWVTLLAEVLNAETLAALRDEHPDIRYSHGFLFQQLVEGPRPVGEVATNLGVTSQAVSKMVRELEALGYVTRVADPDDARVRRVGVDRAWTGGDRGWPRDPGAS